MNVAVVGCGYWGQNLIRNFHALQALRCVCESEARGQARARELAPGVPVLSSFDELLTTDVPAVVIATPAETHHRLARQALLAGKDVFVEKPLALTLAQGAELVEMARERGRILMVGHILEYHPACRRLEELVRGGELGRLCYIYSNRLSLGKVRREENILWSFAPHDIAAILRLVGELPETVIASGGAYLQPHVADVTVTHLQFPNGVQANIHVNWLHPFKEQRLVVVGTRKMAVFNGVANYLVLYDQRVEMHAGEPVPVKGDGITVEIPDVEPLRMECQAFLEAVATRVPPRTDGESGLRVLAVLELAQRSLSARGQLMEFSSLAWPTYRT